MIFNKNDLINLTLQKFYETFSQMLDTADFVPEKFNKNISKYIYSNLKQKFKEIEVYNLLYLEDQGYKLGLFQKLKIWFSGLKPLYLAEKKKLEEAASLELGNRKKRKKLNNEHSET